jgi:hypothetical protein
LILSMLLCKTVFFIQCLYHELPPLFSLHTSLRARSAICIACSKSNSFYKFTTKVVLQLLPNWHSTASINMHLSNLISISHA